MRASEVLLNARCMRVLNVSLERSLEAGNSIVEPGLHTYYQEELNEARKLVHNQFETPVSSINMLN
jgi:hypothetical protein